MVVDRGPRRWGEIDAEGRQRCVEGVFVRRWQIGEGLDARRERVTRAVQAPLLSVVPAGRPASAPGVVVRHTSSNPVFRCRSGSRPGFPVPLAGLGIQAVGADAGR